MLHDTFPYLELILRWCYWGKKKNQLFWEVKKKVKISNYKNEIAVSYRHGIPEFKKKNKKINKIYIYLYLGKISEDFSKTILNVEIL